MKEDTYTSISSILSKHYINHNTNDIQAIVDLTNQFYDSGYEYSYVEITEFLTSEKNLELIKQVGFAKTMQAAKNMKLGTIVRKKTQQRNNACACGSGKKFKNCCINK